MRIGVSNRISPKDRMMIQMGSELEEKQGEKEMVMQRPEVLRWDHVTVEGKRRKVRAR